MMVNGPTTKTQSGFSLLELLVAFTIMSIGLGMIYTSMGGSARLTAELVQRQQALMLMESLLNQRESVTAHGWNDRGVAGDFQWQVNSEMDPTPSPGTLPMHIVKITVSWLHGESRRNIQAQTMLPQRQLGPGEASP